MDGECVECVCVCVCVQDHLEPDSRILSQDTLLNSLCHQTHTICPICVCVCVSVNYNTHTFPSDDKHSIFNSLSVSQM